MQWLKLPAWKIGDRRFEPNSGLQVSKKQNVSSSRTCKDSILWGVSMADSSVLGLRSFESCVLRAMSSHSSHHSQEVLLFALYVHKGGLKKPQIQREL